jgi:hypothetical protein
VSKKAQRKLALDAFAEARAVYLLSAGWTLSERNIPGGPRWWRDPTPTPGFDQDECREDTAAEVQERRDNTVVYR